MRTWITRAPALLAALATCFCFAPAAGAQVNITVNPTSVRVNIDGSPVFSVTYTRTDSMNPYFASLESATGRFQTGSGGASLILGENPTPRILGWPQGGGGTSVVDAVTIPGSVIAEIRSRRLTQLEYRRSFCDLNGLCFTAPAVTILITSSLAAEASPLSARVASGTDTLVPVRWKLSFGSGVSARADSREGRFVDGRGRVYGPVVTGLLQAAGRGQAEVSETLRVPGSVMKEVLAAHAESGLRFERTFTVNGVPVVGTLALQPANAIQSVGPRPARISVTPQSAIGAGVRWEAALLPGVTGPVGSPLSVVSAEGIFRSPDGRILGRVPATISQPVPPPATTSLSARAAGAVVVVNEQVNIPHTVIDAALATGFAWFSLQRTFRAGDNSAPAELRLNLAGRVAASFGIDRAELRFLDGSRFRTVPRGEDVYVEADITFRGSGRLQASWDLAGPTTTPGAAMFVRRELVDQYLSFGRRTLIRSPAIKAGELGAYTVRLSITAPNFPGGDLLEVRFVVRATGEALEISLVQPQPLARLVAGLPFAWEAVAGARNYQLEFHDMPSAEGREPAAGMILPGGESRTALSQAAERNLKPGRSYWWRVIALGPDGVLLGRSALRELLAPQE